jgi:probable HAF family extracellular repeat protein
MFEPICANAEDAHAGRIGPAPYSGISYLTESIMRRSRFSQSLLAAAALAAPLLAAADPRYTVTAIAGAGSFASDINNLGQVVGSMSAGSAYHGFVYGGGILTDIGTLGGANSGATAINDHGVVVGNAEVDASGNTNGFVYSGGAMSGLSGGAYMQAYGINNNGTVVGSMFVTTPDDSYLHAYAMSGGVVTDLGTLPYGDGSHAFAINNHGEVVGAAANVFNGEPNRPEDPFIYHDGVMTGLGNLGGPWSAALSVNDHGQVVGYLGMEPFAVPDELYPTTAFLYDGSGMHVLGGASAGWASLATDINNLGQVVGSFRPGAAGDHAFLYENGELADLNTLIDPASGWTITGAAAINDLQQIAAQACRAGVCQAVTLDLVSCVPEPPMIALLAAGLALGLARGGRGVRGFRLPVRRRRG